MDRTLVAAAIFGLSLLMSPALAHPGHTPDANPNSLEECTLPQGWTEVEERDPRFVVFGELHGTNEAPQLIEDIVCALAERGESVLLAIEINSNENDALQDAWRGTHDQFTDALEDAGWRGRSDGVASLAMAELVTRAHALKSSGFNVAVTAFNGAKDDEQSAQFADLPGQGPHEAAQAANIAAATEQGRFDRVIVLVGSLHARLSPVTMGDTTFEPMAQKLNAYGSVIGLTMINAPGTSWNCQLDPAVEFVPGEPLPPDAVKCGEYRAGGLPDLERAPFISFDAYPGRERDERFDGFFWVGPISASAPAFPAEE